MKKSATAKRKASNEPAFAPATIKAADLEQYDLTMLMQFYWMLRRSIDDFCALTGAGRYTRPMFTLVDRRFVSPLDRAVDACHAAIKARKPEDRFKIEERNALLYDHAINFDASDEEKRAILAEALVANLSKIKTEIPRFRKSKFGDAGELHESMDGDKTIWRQWIPAKDLKRLKERQAAAKRKRKVAKA
jgi:hypothetical protein